jgi:hypothetical protein
VHRTTTALIAALALAGLSGCGDSGGGSGGGLSDALNAVDAGPASERSFAYTDLAALREVTDLPAPGQRIDRDFMRWNVPATLGAPMLTQRAFGRAGDEGVDLFAADRFVTIGLGGKEGATRIDGFEGDAAPLTGLLDASAAEGDTVVVAGEPALRDAALGKGDERLGDRDDYAAAADCLGDVLAAQISPARLAGFPPDSGDLVAIGVGGGDDPSETLCVVGDAGQVQRSDPALRRALDPDAVSVATNRHISDEVKDVAFATGGEGDHRWARVEVTPDADAQLGYLYRSVYVMLLPRTWFGGSAG